MTGDRVPGDAPRLQQRPATATRSSSAPRVAGFERFYRDQAPRLAWFVVTATGATVQEAWDATQTAMTEAWEKWGNVTHPVAFVRKVALRAFFRQIPNRKFVSDEPVPDGVDRALTPDLVVELTEGTAHVVGLLKHLSMALRLPFALSLDGFSVPEIATITGKTEDTVRRNIHRAKRTLAPKITSKGGAR